MRLARFRFEGAAVYGYLHGAGAEILDGDIKSGFSPTGREAPLKGLKLLCPVAPSKAVCIGKNYLDHIKELGGEPPGEPVIFLKPATSVIGPGEAIMIPGISNRVDYEGELALVVGKTARHVPEERALDYILGYTCANDVTARDLQKKDGQWTRAKGFDTFLPIGPWIVTNPEPDPGAVGIRTILNGRTVQSANTKLMMHRIPALISYITAVMTLLPGDVILTGTPSGIGPMSAGDRVAVEIDGIGRLENPVAAES